jgi:hypothetical protein
VLAGAEVRQSLEMKDWERAQQQIREWEAGGAIAVEVQPVTIEQACDGFLEDAQARKLREPTRTGCCFGRCGSLRRRLGCDS